MVNSIRSPGCASCTCCQIVVELMAPPVFLARLLQVGANLQGQLKVTTAFFELALVIQHPGQVKVGEARVRGARDC